MLNWNFTFSLGSSQVQADNFFYLFDPTRPTMYINIFYFTLFFFFFNSLIDFDILRISFDEFENLKYNLNILYELE